MTSAVRSLRVDAPDAETRDVPEFADFFAAEQTRLYRALVAMTGNRAEAEEIVQDAFLKLWQGWGRIGAMDEPVGYLHRTAMNLYRNRLRRASVALRRGVSLLPSDPPPGSDTVDARDHARRLLAVLTTREREAVVLTGYLGYSAEEAGRLLGIKASTVRVLTTRARAALRTMKEMES
jgi:RNA polymerase sigma-70 factor (ECF subfamily)